MNKIDGLKFLHEHFSKITLNSYFIENENDLSKETLVSIRTSSERFWRVRSACRYGTELALPMGTFYDEDALISFIHEQKMKNSKFEFVLHCIDNAYYYPEYSGTLAVYNDSEYCDLIIELQKITKELIDSMDSSKIRPRDWGVCVAFHYRFLHKSPRVTFYKDMDIHHIKYNINDLFVIGCEIFDSYERERNNTASYTRFNIYSNGSIILNDHRSLDSFIS